MVEPIIYLYRFKSGKQGRELASSRASLRNNSLLVFPRAAVISVKSGKALYKSLQFYFHSCISSLLLGRMLANRCTL